MFSSILCMLTVWNKDTNKLVQALQMIQKRFRLKLEFASSALSELGSSAS